MDLKLLVEVIQGTHQGEPKNTVLETGGTFVIQNHVYVESGGSGASALTNCVGVVHSWCLTPIVLIPTALAVIQ